MIQMNFSGGPGALPDEVLYQVQKSIIEVPETGLSLLGISHRSEWFKDVINQAKENIAQLLNLPLNYHILFLQGGSTLQFSMIPLSFYKNNCPVEHLVTGYWSRKAYPEAQKLVLTNILWDGENNNYARLPKDEELNFSSNASYLHYISNETVEGLQFNRVLGRDDIPRVCDMSSDFLSRPIDVSKFDLIYAHAQKNIGPAGITVVILKNDLLYRSPEKLPGMLDYRNHIEHNSIYNTPPVFAIYVTMLVTKWIREQIGGLEKMNTINSKKASLLYQTIDQSQVFYKGHAEKSDRSLMNVSFRLASAELENLFLKEAIQNKLYGLEGHRSIGGLRASLYNAVTIPAVQKLCAFMKSFQYKYREAYKDD